MTPTQLAARCEAAESSEQRGLLELAWQPIHGLENGKGWELPGGGVETNARWKFDRMIDAEAFESAALMLVPEGMTYQVDEGPITCKLCALIVESCWGVRTKS